MGYTHYWYRKPNLDREAFRSTVRDFKNLIPRLNEFGVKLGNGLGRELPQVTDEVVCFNGLKNCGHPDNHEIAIPWPSLSAGGVGTSMDAITESGGFISTIETRCCNGDCSYETFYFPLNEKADEWQKSADGFVFNFCKTAFRPYDLAVTAFLIIAKHHMPDAIRISSDGADVHWFDAKLLCQMELGYGLNFTLR